VLLDRLAGPLVRAGLRRLNVSLDSLSHVRFAEITRRDALDRVLAGLEEAERYPELRPIKVNCVAIRGFTEEEVPALAELARRKPYVVRFIEFMPLDADEAWRDDDVLTGGEIRALIEERWPLEEIPAKASSTARRFRFADGAGEIGFVNPVSEPFCSSCDRIRLTADGQLRTCLFSRREWDLKTPLREGASDEELTGLIRFAVRHKELKHKISDPGFVRASRSMSQIGG
jgi:cyclic pyranopterin phosphate synthase